MNDSRGAGAFVAPAWLRGAGTASWLLVGVLLVVIGAVALLAITHVIVMPVLTAAVVAAVISPSSPGSQDMALPLSGPVLLLFAIVLLAALVAFLVITGITSQTSDMEGHLDDAKSTLSGWLEDLGADSSTAADAETKPARPRAAQCRRCSGIAVGISALSSLAFFLALTGLCLLFMLKDGPEIRAWVEGKMGCRRPPHAPSRRSAGGAAELLLGTTIVAAFNGVVVGLGALILGVPLAEAIAVITFFAAYVLYVGAWTGAFSVLLALGGAGTDAAIGMAVVQLLANGLLQQIVQLAMGAALGIHPLAVLIVTIAGGALFGTAGLTRSPGNVRHRQDRRRPLARRSDVPATGSSP